MDMEGLEKAIMDPNIRILFIVGKTETLLRSGVFSGGQTFFTTEFISMAADRIKLGQPYDYDGFIATLPTCFLTLLDIWELERREFREFSISFLITLMKNYVYHNKNKLILVSEGRNVIEEQIVEAFSNDIKVFEMR